MKLTRMIKKHWGLFLLGLLINVVCWGVVLIGILFAVKWVFNL